MRRSAGCSRGGRSGGSAVRRPHRLFLFAARRPRRLSLVLPSVRRGVKSGGVKSTAPSPAEAGKRGLVVLGLTKRSPRAVLLNRRAVLRVFALPGCLLVSYMPLAPARRRGVYLSVCWLYGLLELHTVASVLVATTTKFSRALEPGRWSSAAACGTAAKPAALHERRTSAEL